MVTKTVPSISETQTGSTESGLTLATDKGVTIVADSVVAKLAGHACREIEGVAAMGKTFRRLLSRVQPGEAALTRGVNVEVGRKEAAIDIVLVVFYGVSIPALAQEVRENVIARVEVGTGLVVKEVNIEIDDLEFGDEEPRITSRVE